jgi:hypothetical protein
MDVRAWAGGKAPAAEAAAAAAPAAAAPAPAAPAAQAAPPATPAEKRPGALAVRSKDIPREADGIMNLVHNWNNRAVLPQSKLNGLAKPLQHMVAKEMKPLLDDLKKEHDIKTVAGQFKGYFSDEHNPVVCWETNKTHILSLLDQTVGDMKPKDLKTTINKSTLGKNEQVAMLRNYIAIETDEKIRHTRWLHTAPPHAHPVT